MAFLEYNILITKGVLPPEIFTRLASQIWTMIKAC